jgi:hypothetical protein
VRGSALRRRVSGEETDQARPGAPTADEGGAVGSSPRRVGARSLTKGMAIVVGSLVCIAVGLVAVGSPGTAERSAGRTSTSSASLGLPPATLPSAAASGTSGVPVVDTTGNHSAIFDVQQPATGLTPAPAGATADPTPSALATAPPLRADEVFGVVPYWDLDQADAIDVDGLTTVDYFSLDINPDGSIENAGDAWSGYLSQNFLELVNKAHAAGDKVVLTVSDFSQSSLDQLSASPTAPTTLAQDLLLLLKARDLDGVNLDFEGQGTADQTGITNLVKTVSQTLRAADASYQITMDTYSSSASDANGFYDLAGLSSSVDAFMVMAYQLNVNSPPSTSSSMTSAEPSIQSTLNSYALAVPLSKVILSLPLFGEDWPTSSGNLHAQAVGSPTVVTDAQEAAAGHPVYWDSVTDTAWTSYQVGPQWHEAFFQNPDSVYLISAMARNQGVAGVGAWALGMDGSDEDNLLSALIGNAPSHPDMLAGPLSSGAAGTALVNPLGTGTPTPRRHASAAATTTTQPATTTTRATTTTTAVTTTTTTTAAAATAAPGTYTYSGNWLGAKTAVIPTAVPNGARTVIGVLSGFKTNFPGLKCLNNGAPLYVVTVAGAANADFAIADRSAGDCMKAAFVWDTASSPPG